MAFVTEATIPTLEQFDFNTAKKLKDICRDMEGLMSNTSSKISGLLQNQQNSFFKAFKIVVEQISADFKALQQKFEEYIAYHEKETEVVNAQNKLVFFRNECQILNKMCNDLTNENKLLKLKIKENEDEIKNHKILLLKSIGKNSKLQEIIENLRNKLPSEPKFVKDKFRVPQLKLNQRFNTEYEQKSVSVLSNQIVKGSKHRKLNLTTDGIMEVSQKVQPSMNPALGSDQFYEQSYKSRAKSQQQTLKKLEQTDTTQKTQEFSYSMIKSIKINPQSFKYNVSISS